MTFSRTVHIGRMQLVNKGYAKGFELKTLLYTGTAAPALPLTRPPETEH